MHASALISESINFEAINCGCGLSGAIDYVAYTISIHTMNI